jgi:hypothetical protein
MAEVFTLPKDSTREPVVSRLAKWLLTLPAGKVWRVTVEEQRKTRSDAQNRYLWGVCYPAVLRGGGETLGGWTAEDLHEYFLGEHFGWETIEGFGRKRIRPIRRSSRLTPLEFAGYVASIQLAASNLGIYVPDPDQHL